MLNKKLISKLSYGIVIILCVFLFILMFTNSSEGVSIHIILNGCILFFLAIALFFQMQNIKHDKKLLLIKRVLLFLLLLYVFQLVYMLFFAKEFSRDRVGMVDGTYLDSLRVQWNYGTNLTPFYTIKSMLQIFHIETIENSVAYINLLGNFIAFMPFAIFLPLLWKKTRRTSTFLFIMAFLITMVEVLQFFTLTGSMDIDDFILNFLGVMIVYFFWKLPFLKKHLR